MAPPGKDSGGSARRKSINIFSRASLGGLPHINTDIANHAPEDGEKSEKKERKKFGKRTSIFSLGPAASPDLLSDGTMSPVRTNSGSNSPKLRPRTLQKGRPTSIFGSLGKKSMGQVSEEDGIGSLVGTPESPMEDGGRLLEPGSNGNSKIVLHHGEVQTTTGMFRKKKEYLVLTDTHLLRFKSQSRASEVFPSIQPSYGRSSTTRHPSTTSIGSLHDIQSTNSHASAEGENKVPLRQIVTAYKLEDGRPFFTTEVVYLDEEYHGVGSIQLMLHDPKEADLWHTSIRGAAQKARLLMEEPYPARVVQYLVQVLESVADYDARHFQVFRVVRRSAVPKGGKNSSSSDDLQKLGASVFYMVIGINRLHMIPLPDFTEPSQRLLSSKTSRSTFGLVTLTSLNVNYTDDRFEISFRSPLQRVVLLQLAASATPDIAVVLFRAVQYVKPQWIDYHFTFDGPRRLLETAETPAFIEEEEDEDYGCFDRTLIAYCMAYNCNPTNIQYGVDWEVEDAPEFRLYPPANASKYSFHELLAIMRALRYNESFYSVSFRGIDLHSIHGLHDDNGSDHVAATSRSGISISEYFGLIPHEKSLLHQEVQALALKSRRLRRLDFADCLPRRRPKDTFDVEGGEVEKDPGCEIVAGILPLCRAQITNVDWIILTGIELGETDLDHLIPTSSSSQSRLRGLECGRCGLNDRGIMQLMTVLERQHATLEAFDISDNPGRVHVEKFQYTMTHFTKIRKLNLSRITRTSGEEPLFTPQMMMQWRLEELIMNGVPINEKTLDSIATYLASDMSDSLRVLEMDQCNIHGSHVALMMQSMTRTPGVARELQLHVSANRLEKGIRDIVTSIETNHTPSHLVLRMIEFSKEDHFKRLIEALRKNTTIRSLDISKASLPYDAGPETCDALRDLFAENTTLEEFDISGEHAHLEVTRFGIGLNHALTGLKKNSTLKVLRIEYQNLGLEGANTLCSVLEENKGLTHIHCEHNDINLQGYTILVNALANNHTVLEIPLMRDDQGESMKRMGANMRDSRKAASAAHDHRKSTVLKTLTSFGSHRAKEPDLTPQDVDAVVRVLGEKWETEMQRMSMFLQRNRNIAAGIEGYGPDSEVVITEEVLRPTTAMSDRRILEQVLSNTTPKVELGNPVESHVADKFESLAVIQPVEVASGTENTKVISPADVSGTQKAGNHDLGRVGALPELPPIEREKVFELGDSGMFEMES